MSLTLEMRGIAPRTSSLISGRSTIWPTSHVYQISRNFFWLSQQLWSFSFRSQKIYLLGISICNRLSADSDFHLVKALVLEMRGIDPRNSRMESELSTIWATSHSLELSRKLLFQSANKSFKISVKVFLV